MIATVPVEDAVLGDELARCRAFAYDVFGTAAVMLTIYSAIEQAGDGSYTRAIYDVRAQDRCGRDLDLDWTTPFWQAVCRERRDTSRWPLPWADAVGDVLLTRWQQLPAGDDRTVIVVGDMPTWRALGDRCASNPADELIPALSR